MNTLQQFNDETTTNICELQATIEQLKSQLEQAQATLDASLKIQAEQNNLTEKWKKTTLPNLEQTFKDACSLCNSKDVIDSMLEDIKSLAEKMKKRFEEREFRGAIL